MEKGTCSPTTGCTENLEEGDLKLPGDDQQLSRRQFRSLVFHILYAADAWDYQLSVPALIDIFNRGFETDIALESDVTRVSEAVINERDALDQAFKPFLLNWRFERLGLCTKLILRLAFWELQQKETIPTIIINEAIELAKCFAEKDAYKFINGILDEAAKALEAQQ